jgi:hypothetical protein
MAKKQAEAQVAASTEECDRLAEANATLSARALTMAEDAEQEKKALRDRLQEEIEALKIRVRESEEDADEQKMRGQSQRIQLLDEVCHMTIIDAFADDIAQLASGGSGRIKETATICTAVVVSWLISVVS